MIIYLDIYFMKPVVFLGNSLATIRSFPDVVRREAGYQLYRLQHGFDPTDWKPMPSIGQGSTQGNPTKE